MSKRYRSWTQDQLYLLPPSMRDWLPEGHLAWFVLDVVKSLDIGEIEGAIQSKDSRGLRWSWFVGRFRVQAKVYSLG